MIRVLTFSRVFPSYHPRAGEPTYFVEKIWNSICWDNGIPEQQFPIPYHIGIDFRNTDEKKNHTIRAGHRWKAGDWFSPRVWSDKPYRSKQIAFAPDIEVKKVWNFDIRFEDVDRSFNVILNGINIYYEGPHGLGGSDKINWIPANDGLSNTDFFDWFKWPNHEFSGQIICWNESINY